MEAGAPEDAQAQETVPVDENDAVQGKPVFLVRPSDNVYSYFMFIGPTEEKRQQVKAELHNQPVPTGINWDVAMGWVLVALNFFMQLVLLYLIFNEVVIENVEWQNGIMKLGGKGGDHVMGLLSKKDEGCNDGEALCFVDHKGKLTCAPPTIQLLGRWDELDTNGDGVWTRDEVKVSEEDLRCKYAVDPIQVFDVVIQMLMGRGDMIWLHPNILGGTGIHEAYFKYVMADIIMCGYRSQAMCGNLLERGVFDAPLKHGTSPRVGTTIDSALKYCRELLEPGGRCEQLLPSTYAVWKITSNEECGEPSYEMFKYTSPGNAQSKQLLKVDYSARQEYERAEEAWFKLFKGIIVFTWLLAMSVELKDVIKIMTLCLRHPDADDFGENAVLVQQDPADPEDVRYVIQGLTRNHRMTMILICILRTLLTCILVVVGVFYIIKTNDYADLIMNGVALAFIAEISSVLYDQVLREEVKDQTGDIKAIPTRMYGIDYLNRRPALVDILCVVCIAVVVVVVMSWQQTVIVSPVRTALECTCLAQGDTCTEAQKYSSEFWAEYWMKGLPDALEAIDALKAQVPGAVGPKASYLAVASATSLRSEIEEQKSHLAEDLKDIRRRESELETLQAEDRAVESKPPGRTAPPARSGHGALPRSQGTKRTPRAGHVRLRST